MPRLIPPPKFAGGDVFLACVVARDNAWIFAPRPRILAVAQGSCHLAVAMAGIPYDLHVQTRHVLLLVWSVTLLRAPSETQHPHPARLARPTYMSCTTVAALGPRADAMVRSTSPPKIDVLSARSTETASGERVRVTDELQGPKNCQWAWARGAGPRGGLLRAFRYAMRSTRSSEDGIGCLLVSTTMSIAKTLCGS